MTNGVQTEKQGMSTGAKIAIGCGGLFVLAVIVSIILLLAGGFFAVQTAKHVAETAGVDTELMKENPGLAAAKMMVAADPKIEVVDTDVEDGTITIREKKTGKEITVNFEEIKEGKISFRSEDGEMTIETEQVEEGGGTISFSGDKGEEKISFGSAADEDKIPNWVPRYSGDLKIGSISESDAQGFGMFSIETSGSLEDIGEYYKSSLKQNGFSVTSTFREMEGMRMISVHGMDEAQKRRVTVNAQDEKGRIKISVIFNYSR